MSSTESSTDSPTFQIKITLEGGKPPIWRRLLVRSDTTLGDLHHIIQAASVSYTHLTLPTNA